MDASLQRCLQNGSLWSVLAKEAVKKWIVCLDQEKAGENKALQCQRWWELAEHPEMIAFVTFHLHWVFGICCGVNKKKHKQIDSKQAEFYSSNAVHLLCAFSPGV